MTFYSGTTIVKKYARAVKESADATAHFNQFNDRLTEEQVAPWKQAITIAEECRESNPEGMDIYAPKVKKAPSRQQVELMLSHQEMNSDGPGGQASWISQGLKIEYAQ